MAAAVLGALAGLMQAMGLLRWVMVVPGLAGTPDGAALFAMLHAYAGVAVGEHLGMLLTAGFVGTLAAVRWGEARHGVAALGGVTALAIAAGAFEGVALALGLDGGALGLAAVAGYLLLTVWLVWEGVALLGPGRRASALPA